MIRIGNFTVSCRNIPAVTSGPASSCQVGWSWGPAPRMYELSLKTQNSQPSNSQSTVLERVQAAAPGCFFEMQIYVLILDILHQQHREWDPATYFKKPFRGNQPTSLRTTALIIPCHAALYQAS
jgi:hypothetical protein